MILDLPDGRELDVPDNLAPEDRNRLKAKLRLKYGRSELKGPSTFAGSTPISTTQDRALSYLTKRGSEVGGAFGRVARDLAVPPSLRPERPMGEKAMDLATVAGTIAAPRSTLFGAGLGAAGQAEGLSPEQASNLDIAGTLAGGAIGGLRGAYRGVKAGPGLARAAAKAKYASVAEAAKGIEMTPAQIAQLKEELVAAVEWGGTRPMEAKAVQPLIAKLTAPWPHAPPTYADLDSAYAGLQRIKGASYMRGIIDDHIKLLLKGSPAAEARSAAKAAWMASKAKASGRGLVPGAAALAGFGKAAHDLSEGRPGRAAADVAGGLLGAWGLRNLTGPALVDAARGAARGGAGAALSAGPRIATQVFDTPNSTTTTTLPQPPTLEPERTPEAPPPQAPNELAKHPWGREITVVAHVVGVPARLVATSMHVESGNDPNAVSPKGAIGLMQLMPGTFEELRPQIEALTGRKASITDRLDNIVAGALYWKKALDATGGDLGAAARYYNAGPGGMNKGYAETLGYERKVLSRFGG